MVRRCDRNAIPVINLDETDSRLVYIVVGLSGNRECDFKTAESLTRHETQSCKLMGLQNNRLLW